MAQAFRTVDIEFSRNRRSSSKQSREQKRERDEAYNQALCHKTPLVPQPDGAAKKVTRFWEGTRLTTELIFGAILAGLELDLRWNQDYDMWRVWVGVLALVAALDMLFILLAMAMNYMNEIAVKAEFKKMVGENVDPDSKIYKEALSTLQDRILMPESGSNRIKLEYWNLPVPRLGFVYKALMSTAMIIIWTYMYKELNTGNGIHPVTFNDVRTFRVFIWLTLFVSVTDLIVWFVDMMSLLHVGLNSEDKDMKACIAMGDIHCPMMVTKPPTPGKHDDYPDVDLLLAWQQPVQTLTVGACIVLAFLHIEQLWQGPDSFWDIGNWRLADGTASLVAGGFFLFHLLAWFVARGHKCARRVIRDGALYYLAFFFGFGTVWYYEFKVASDIIEADSLALQSYETYQWLSLFFAALHVFFVIFHGMRCYISGIMQRVYCPNLYGF
jgi:hypothetical protein